MSVATATTAPLANGAMFTVCQPYRLTVKQYDRMIEASILTAEDRVELLKGLLVEKRSRNPPHDSAVSRINKRLLRVLPEEWTLRVRSAVVLRDSEPEPDFAIVRGAEVTYDRRKPTRRDVGVLIEVADSTLLDDHRLKAQFYAEARVREYWIVNLVDRRIEIGTQPRGGKAPGYRQQQSHDSQATIALALDGKAIAQLAVRDWLPR